MSGRGAWWESAEFGRCTGAHGDFDSSPWLLVSRGDHCFSSFFQEKERKARPVFYWYHRGNFVPCFTLMGWMGACSAEFRRSLELCNAFPLCECTCSCSLPPDMCMVLNAARHTQLFNDLLCRLSRCIWWGWLQLSTHLITECMNQNTWCFSEGDSQISLQKVSLMAIS